MGSGQWRPSGKQPRRSVKGDKLVWARCGSSTVSGRGMSEGRRTSWLRVRCLHLLWATDGGSRCQWPGRKHPVPSTTSFSVGGQPSYCNSFGGVKLVPRDPDGGVTPWTEWQRLPLLAEKPPILGVCYNFMDNRSYHTWEEFIIWRWRKTIY